MSGALRDFKHLICYAVKANSNLSVLGFFERFGSGYDVVSEGELRRVLASGGDPHKVVFSGVAKLPEEIRFALSQEIKFFNVESISELKSVARIAEAAEITAPVSLRINPDVSVDTHRYLATGLNTSKFGIPSSELAACWEIINGSKGLNLVAVDCHIGSQLNDIAALEAAYSKILEAAKFFEGKGARIEAIDFGGGHAVSFSGHYEPLDLSAYSAMLKRILSGTNYEVIVEPGKFLMAAAGVLLTRVIYLKQNGENRFVVVDAGMNDLIRPSLYGAYHRIDPIDSSGHIQNADLIAGDKLQVDVVGPVCETGCYLAEKRMLPLLAEGQLLAVRDSGAYGFSMASRYNSRLLPAEVMVNSEGRGRLIRQRESYEEIWKHEIPTASKSF